MKWLCILISISLNSCSNLNVAGLYGGCENGYLSCNQILINSDSTYTYYEYWDVGGTHNIVDGYWKRKGDTLFLTSYIQKEPCKLSFVTSAPYIKSKFGIKIIDNYNEPVSRMIFKAYSKGKELIQISDFDGFCQVENIESIDSIRISSHGLPICDSIFILNDEKIMDYHFKLDYNHVNIAMKNEPWLIKDNKVYFHQDSTGKFDKSIYKKKTTLDKKVF